MSVSHDQRAEGKTHLARPRGDDTPAGPLRRLLRIGLRWRSFPETSVHYCPSALDPGLGLITDYPWSAPYEDVKLKPK